MFRSSLHLNAARVLCVSF